MKDEKVVVGEVTLKKGKPLTPKQRSEAIALWKAGEATLEELATRFKCSPRTLSRLFSKRGIKKGEEGEAVEKKVAAAVETALVDDAAILSARIRETKEEHYKMAKGLATLIWAEVIQARKKELPLATILLNVEALNKALKGLQISREERFAVLGILNGDNGPEGELPDLVVQELPDELIKKMQRKALDAEAEIPDLEMPDTAALPEEL